MGGNEPQIEYLAYLKDIQSLVELKCSAKTIESFANID